MLLWLWQINLKSNIQKDQISKNKIQQYLQEYKKKNKNTVLNKVKFNNIWHLMKYCSKIYYQYVESYEHNEKKCQLTQISPELK